MTIINRYEKYNKVINVLLSRSYFSRMSQELKEDLRQTILAKLVKLHNAHITKEDFTNTYVMRVASSIAYRYHKTISNTIKIPIYLTDLRASINRGNNNILRRQRNEIQDRYNKTDIDALLNIEPLIYKSGDTREIRYIDNIDKTIDSKLFKKDISRQLKNKLSSLELKIVKLFYLDCYKDKEIGNILNIPINKITNIRKNIIVKLRKNKSIKRYLEENWINE